MKQFETPKHSRVQALRRTCGIVLQTLKYSTLGGEFINIRLIITS